ASAQVHNHGVTLDERRASQAKESFARAKLFLRINPPDLLAVLQIPAMQRPFRPKSINTPVRHRRGGAWPWLKAKIVLIRGGIFRLPKDFARFGVEALHHLVVVDAMKQNQLAAAYRRPAEA